MNLIVSFDSAKGKILPNGMPEGLTLYHERMSPKLRQQPRRWRVEFEAFQSELEIVAGDDLSPPLKLTLHDLTHTFVLPRIDGLIKHVREQVELLTGWKNTESVFVITTKFKIYRWR